jgi:hypothetical protein
MNRWQAIGGYEREAPEGKHRAANTQPANCIQHSIALRRDAQTDHQEIRGGPRGGGGIAKEVGDTKSCQTATGTGEVKPSSGRPNDIGNGAIACKLPSEQIAHLTIILASAELVPAVSSPDSVGALPVPHHASGTPASIAAACANGSNSCATTASKASQVANRRHSKKDG